MRFPAIRRFFPSFRSKMVYPGPYSSPGLSILTVYDVAVTVVPVTVKHPTWPAVAPAGHGAVARAALLASHVTWSLVKAWFAALWGPARPANTVLTSTSSLGIVYEAVPRRFVSHRVCGLQLGVTPSCCNTSGPSSMVLHWSRTARPVVVPPLTRRPRRPNRSVPRHTKFVSTKFDTYASSSMIVTAVGRPTGNAAFWLAIPRIRYPPPPGRPGWRGAVALKKP